MTKNADIDKSGYSGNGIGFDRKSSLISADGGKSQNLWIFGADMSSSVHVDYKKKYILVLRKGPIQGLGHALTAKKNVFT